MAPPDVARVRRALSAAHRVLWKTQKPDGSWDMPGDLGPWVTAQVTVALHGSPVVATVLVTPEQASVAVVAAIAAASAAACVG